MRKLIFTVVIIVGCYYLGKYFIKSGNFDKLLQNYKNPFLVPRIEYYLGHINLILNKPQQAEYRFQRVLKNYPETKFAPASLYYLAKLHQEKDINKAIQEYNILIEKWPDSKYANIAVKAIEILKYAK